MEVMFRYSDATAKLQLPALTNKHRVLAPKVNVRHLVETLNVTMQQAVAVRSNPRNTGIA